ncbi:MAG: glycosyltransferase [Tannerellaceae bacterium]|jgi:glycosyltransferase involved in cell wall biosynthesis|nr:glycosyltransferase [Tannerellaceae bacterium]
MKILILCDMFPPAFGPRMGYLCKYLARAGWEAVVLTEYIGDQTFAFLTGHVPVHYIRYYKAKGRVSRQAEWILLFLADFFFGYKDRKMVRLASRFLKAGGFGGILCSTYRTFPLPAARKLAKRFRLPLIADMRDIIEQYPSHEYIARPPHLFPWLDKQIIRVFRRKLLRGRNRALREAACITTVSPWHVEQMKAYNPRVELIYNGYDPELFYPVRIPAPQFRLTYTGRLVSLDVRDPEWLFQAIRSLSETGVIHPEEFRVCWYTDEASAQSIRLLAGRYAVAAYMDYFGYVPADRIPAILNESSALLQLANKADEKGPKGIMSTKLFEAFAVEKPLLLVRSDESYLEETIHRAQAGIAARQAEDVCRFIRHHFAVWKEKGYTTIEPRREITASFSREQQARQFMHIFTEKSNKDGTYEPAYHRP